MVKAQLEERLQPKVVEFRTNWLMLVPQFDPATDDVTVWSGKVELLLSTWPKDKLNELATRLILGCKGSMFLKLQLNRASILTGSEKGIKLLVELVGGSFGQVPLERKFELAEKALFKCQQKMDESSDSYLSRCDVVWAELLARNMQLAELQAFIMLRGSRLTADDKKRVIVESGGETSGVLEMKKVTAAVRMLGSGFFQEMSGTKRDRPQKIYDQSAFAIEDAEDHPEAETFMTYEENFDDEGLETLAMDYHDEDAALVLQFEDALMETIQADAELSVFYTSYQDARKRLADRQKSRGFLAHQTQPRQRWEEGCWKREEGQTVTCPTNFKFILPNLLQAWTLERWVSERETQNRRQFNIITELYGGTNILRDGGGRPWGDATSSFRSANAQ